MIKLFRNTSFRNRSFSTFRRKKEGRPFIEIHEAANNFHCSGTCLPLKTAQDSRIQCNKVNKNSRTSLAKIFCSIRESCAVLSGKHLDSVHKYPDIFESATFSFQIKNFPRPHVSVFKSNFPVHTYPTRIRIHSLTQDSSGNIGNRTCVEVAILKTVFTVKNWARSCYVTG